MTRRNRQRKGMIGFGSSFGEFYGSRRGLASTRSKRCTFHAGSETGRHDDRGISPKEEEVLSCGLLILQASVLLYDSSSSSSSKCHRCFGKRCFTVIYYYCMSSRSASLGYYVMSLIMIHSSNHIYISFSIYQFIFVFIMNAD